MKRNISLGTINISSQAKRYLNDIYQTKRLSYGKYSQQFEKLIAKLHHCKYASFCNSGTSALQVAIQALKIRYQWTDDAEIIAPALTFVASINTILYNQLKVRLVDVDPQTFNIDPQKIVSAINHNTKAILVVHLFGQPANMTSIVKIARQYHLKIIEDSCETMFATHCQQPVGSFGEVACFSTHAAHLITTGVGGIITCRNSQLNLLTKSLINHGRDPKYLSIDDDNQKLAKHKQQDIIESRFLFKHFGYSYRLTEIEASIGLAQLTNHQQMIKKRQANATYLSKKLAVLADFLQLPIIDENNTHVFMVYPLVIKNRSIKLKQLIYYLEDNGIETRFLLPLIDQPIYKFLKLQASDYPVANKLQKAGFYIGCHQDLKKADLDYIVAVFINFFKCQKK